MNNNKVNLFIPSEMDMFSPLVANSVIKVLERLGDHIIYNPEQTSCGRRFYFEGETQYARELANKFVKEIDYNYPIVSPSTSSVSFIRDYYKELLKNMSEVTPLRKVTQNVYELCYYIVQIKKVTNLGNSFNHRVFYFKSCAAKNYYKIDNEPEILLNNTKDLDLLTDDTLNLCCGANGTFATSNPDVSDKLLSSIIEKIYLHGVQYITSTDIECLQHIDAYLQTLPYNMQVIHIADILNGEDNS